MKKVMDYDGDYDKSPKSGGGMSYGSINQGLAKKYGTPLNASEGNLTQSKTSYPKKNASIMSNPNTKSDRCGYGVNGVGK